MRYFFNVSDDENVLLPTCVKIVENFTKFSEQMRPILENSKAFVKNFESKLLDNFKARKKKLRQILLEVERKWQREF